MDEVADAAAHVFDVLALYALHVEGWQEELSEDDGDAALGLLGDERLRQVVERREHILFDAFSRRLDVPVRAAQTDNVVIGCAVIFGSLCVSDGCALVGDESKQRAFWQR